MDDVLDPIETTETEPVVETQETYQEETQLENQDGQQQTEAEKVDGRRFNPEWSKALKELRELYPDKADMLTKMRDNYARYQALQEVAPKGLDDVRQWKTTLDALGGAEAASEMMQQVANVEAIDAKIAASDFSVLSELPDELQKGVYGMLPDMLNHLAETDDKAFATAVMPHFASALAGTGMGEHLQKMYAAAGDNEPLKELIKQQYDWFQAKVQGRGQLPAGKSADPQVARLQAELDSRRQSDESAFIKGVTDTTNSYVSTVFDKESSVYLKQLNLTDAQKADLAESFNVKLVDKLANDTAFQKQLAAYKALKNRNPDQVNTYIRGKIDEISKPIIDGLVTARYGGVRQKRAAPATTTTTTDNGATRVAQTPPQDQWDMAKMDAAGYDATAKIGKFFLKGGRTVQVVRQ